MGEVITFTFEEKAALARQPLQPTSESDFHSQRKK